jgi:hypothetical protein
VKRAGQAAREAGSAGAQQKQRTLPVQGGTIKPNRPPTEYEVRVYKVMRVVLTCRLPCKRLQNCAECTVTSIRGRGAGVGVLDVRAWNLRSDGGGGGEHASSN